MEIVYVKNGEPKVINCKVMSIWGDAWYDKVKNRIIKEYHRGHTEGTAGGYKFYIYDWDGQAYLNNEKFEGLYAELQSIQKPENVLEVVTSGEFELNDKLKREQSEKYNTYLQEKFVIE